MYPDTDIDTFELNENVSRYRFRYSKNKSIQMLSEYACIYFGGQLWYVVFVSVHLELVSNLLLSHLWIVVGLLCFRVWIYDKT